MKEQQKRKFKQIHPEIEDGIDLRRCPLKCWLSVAHFHWKISEALSPAFLLWDQPGALDAEILTTDEIGIIVIL